MDEVLRHPRHDGLDAGLDVALEGRDLELPRLLEVGREDRDVIVARKPWYGPAGLAREAGQVDRARLADREDVEQCLEPRAFVAEVELVGGVGQVGGASRVEGPSGRDLGEGR
jgi:hypothetical protein